MERTVGEVIAASRAMERLCEQDLSYDVNVGYRMLRLRDELMSVSDYAISRIGKVVDLEHTDNEQYAMLFDVLMAQTVEISDVMLTEEEVFDPKNGEVTLSLSDTEAILRMFRPDKHQ